MVKKVIRNLESSKASDPDCVPVAFLKNIHTSGTLQYVSERVLFSRLTTAINYRTVSLLSVVSNVFEKLVNNRIVDHLEKCGLFSDFQYSFRSSRSTEDLLTVASDRIARAFNRSGATRAVALDIFKAFDKVWHAGLLYKFKPFSSDIWPYFFFSQ